MNIQSLWRHRTKPHTMKEGVKVWCKRLITGPALIRLVAIRLLAQRFGASIHPSAVLEELPPLRSCKNLQVGEGSIIGRDVTLMLHEKIIIGRNVAINRGVRLLTASHDVNAKDWQLVKKPIHIGDYCWVATGATILPGVHLERGAVVGAGAVVRKTVKELSIAIGNPAEPISRGRGKDLEYSPAYFTSACEAWLGPNGGRRIPRDVERC